MSTTSTDIPKQSGGAPEAPAALDARFGGLSARAIRLLRDARDALEHRRVAEADQLLERAQPMSGEHPEFLRLVGVARQLQNRPQEAVAVLRRALENAPGDALILTNLGTALRASGELDAAITAMRRACDLAPELAASWYNLGRALASVRRTGEAHEMYARALECDPNHVRARMSYGDTLRALGKSAEAAVEYRRALELPGSILAWTRLSGMQTVRMTAEETQRLERLFSQPGLSDDDRITVGFALAKALEDHGRYAEAYTVLSSANSVKRRQTPWNAEEFSGVIDTILRAFAQPPATASPPELGHEVIFVVSLPRSGSTLIEHILASHHDVEGASELADLGHVLDAESRRTGVDFPEWVARATPADWRRMGEDYLARTAHWRRERRFFTDKGLSNWRLLGAAMAMLPGARIVNCRRDPIETCFSCYRQLFPRGQAFAYDLSELAAYWRDYDRLMRFWNARYPNRIREQSYENLIADPEAQARALLAFCGLEYDPACLRFHETARDVHTLSGSQVREPLRGDTARAPLYKELLTPLRLALGLR